MRRFGIFLIILIATVSCSSAFRRIQYGTTAKSRSENECYSVSVSPGPWYYDQTMTLKIINKTNKDLVLDWNETLYIKNGTTFGGFMTVGDNYYQRELAKQNSTDIIFSDHAFSKTIAPKKLVYFHAADELWYHHEFGEGEHGVYVSVKCGTQEIKSKVYILGTYEKTAFGKVISQPFGSSAVDGAQTKPVDYLNTAEKGGGIFDEATRLNWQKNDPGKMTWEEAMQYCSDLTVDGFSDWRLPSVEQLPSLYNIRSKIPYYPVSGDEYFWSSTSNKQYQGYAFGMYASSGDTFDDGFKDTAYFVRCVR